MNIVLVEKVLKINIVYYLVISCYIKWLVIDIFF